jgi:NDP-sugar pyrophosphorylase family protein
MMKNNPSSVKAMILAAGLGTRLKPMTDTMPKALVRVQGKTLLEHAINHLAQFGIRQIIVNVHHFAGQIIDFLQVNNNFGLEITVSDESGELLDTGGGLKKVGPFFSDGNAFIVRNVDILSDLDLEKLLNFHWNHSPLATLAVRKRETSRYFLFDETGQLTGWKNKQTEKQIQVREPLGEQQQLAFSGIQVLDPQIFSLITEQGKFSLTELYLRLAATERIVCFHDDGLTWKDVGKSIHDLD